MIAPAFARREFLSSLKNQMVPLVEDGSALLIPAHPIAAARLTRVLPQRARLLRALRSGRSSTLAAHWVEEGLNAPRYPTLVWVEEGEADFRLGVTRRMIAQNPKLPARFGAYVLQLPAQSFFLVPAGIPISDASRPHWERPQLEKARSKLVWLNVLPAGISFHACQTDGQKHTSTRSLFVEQARFLPLFENVLEEIYTAAPHHDAVVRHYFAAFLFQIRRALESTRTPLEESALTPPLRVAGSRADGSTPVGRARRYIEENLDQKISLGQIAAYAYVSPAHLNRLFREELQTTPGRYLSTRRMEKARSLLETTDLPIGRVALLSGFPNAEYFHRVFHRDQQIAPGQFRRRSRRDNSSETK